jgi:hypothetical protein
MTLCYMLQSIEKDHGDDSALFRADTRYRIMGAVVIALT